MHAEWTYTGQVLRDGKLYHRYVDEAGEAWSFKKPIGGTSAAIGAVLQVFVSEKTVRTAGDNSPRYLRRLDIDDPRLVEWTLRDRSARTEADLVRRQRDDAKQDALVEVVGPLRDEYRRLIGRTRKAALLAAIIEAVTS